MFCYFPLTLYRLLHLNAFILSIKTKFSSRSFVKQILNSGFFSIFAWLALLSTYENQVTRNVNLLDSPM